jgi:hypothetical protein
MNGNGVLFRSFSQPVGVGLDVCFLNKADLPVVSPLDYVDGQAWWAIAMTTRHRTAPRNSAVQFAQINLCYPEEKD